MSRKRNKEKLIRIILNQGSIDAKENYDDLLQMLVDEPIAINVDKDEERTFGEKLADNIAEIAGSWGFILFFLFFLFLWMFINLHMVNAADPYPFILLNLVLSCIAAIQAPIIMMSQNREAKRERLKSTNDFKTNIKSELILEKLYEKMEEILKTQKKILEHVDPEELEEILNEEKNLEAKEEEDIENTIEGAVQERKVEEEEKKH